MTDEAKALVDHARGCEGRTYSCTCGYDDARDNLIETQAREIERLREAGQSILPYLVWAIGPESPGYHPTMPSAVKEFRAALGESHD